MTDVETITVAQWNLEADGGEVVGERWGRAHDILEHYEPDIVLRQEAQYSRRRGNKRLYASEDRLGLRGFLAAPNPDADADIATAVLIRPELFAVIENRPRAKPWWLHPCHVLVRFGSCPVPLNLVSFHMCWFDADTRLTEARWLTTLAQPGMVTLAGGDTNSYPHRPEPTRLPDWSNVSDPAHRAHRTLANGLGHHSDTLPDEVLTSGNPASYEDLARYAADHRAQPAALAPTAGHHRPDQSGPQRIDRTYGSGGLAAAVASVEVINTAEIRSVSDHSLLITRLYTARVERLLHEQAAAAYA